MKKFTINVTFLKAENYKIDFVSFPLARLNIKNVRHNKFAMIIFSYYDINI